MSNVDNPANHNANNTKVLCPRCGYDLRGISATYENAWPLNCVCSECGLDFTWKEFFEEKENPWLFEWYHKGHLFRSYFKTNIKMLKPWQFLREIKLTDNENIRSILTLAIFNILVYFLLYTIVVVSIDVLIALKFDIVFSDYLFAICARLLYRIRMLSVNIFGIFVLGSLIPITSVGLRSTLSQARILNRHFIRLTAYSFVFLTLPLLIAATGLIFNLAWNGLSPGISVFPWFIDYAYGYYVLTFTLLIIWWGYANSRYLKIKHPWYVSIAMVTISGLIILTITALLAEYKVIDVF